MTPPDLLRALVPHLALLVPLARAALRRLAFPTP